MPANTTWAADMQQLIHDSIPLAAAMKLRVLELSANAIRMEAPVAQANINVHGTAFAGSIYSTCALSAWGLVHNRLHRENISAEVVLAHAEISYRQPIKATIRSTCRLDEEAWHEFQLRLLKKGRARIELQIIVEEAEEIMATMTARIAARVSLQQPVDG